MCINGQPSHTDGVFAPYNPTANQERWLSSADPQDSYTYFANPIRTISRNPNFYVLVGILFEVHWICSRSSL